MSWLAVRTMQSIVIGKNSRYFMPLQPKTMTKIEAHDDEMQSVCNGSL
jgi:hypothetical protein